MNRINFFLTQLELEAVTTRKMLDIVPADQFDWQPHPKSMNLRALCTHIAELPTWISMALTTDELDFAVNPYQPEHISSNEELIALFEKSMAEGRAQLTERNEIVMDEPWTLRNGSDIYVTDAKYAIVRMSISQIIHHRAQLGVYLRLLNIPIPGSYGPSADELGL